MRDGPVLLVAGLGRCGTTLVMQMLAAAGVPVAGRAPAYEDVPVSLRGVDLDWLDRQRGRAVKWIDPVNARIANPDDWRFRVILLSRSPREQARSMLKFQGLPAPRATVRGLESGIIRDQNRAARIVDRLAGAHGTLHLRFEDLIDMPAVAAFRIAKFCDAHGFPFGEVGVAAAEVQSRGSGCASDMSIEAGLMQRAERAGVWG